MPSLLYIRLITALEIYHTHPLCHTSPSIRSPLLHVQCSPHTMSHPHPNIFMAHTNCERYNTTTVSNSILTNTPSSSLEPTGTVISPTLHSASTLIIRIYFLSLCTHPTMKHLPPLPTNSTLQLQPLPNNANVIPLHPYPILIEQSFCTCSPHHKPSSYYSSLRVIPFSAHQTHELFHGHHSTPRPLVLISSAPCSQFLVPTIHTIGRITAPLSLSHETTPCHTSIIQIKCNRSQI